MPLFQLPIVSTIFIFLFLLSLIPSRMPKTARALKNEKKKRISTSSSNAQPKREDEAGDQH